MLKEKGESNRGIARLGVTEGAVRYQVRRAKGKVADARQKVRLKLDRRLGRLDTSSMKLIDERTARDYLVEQGLIERDELVQVRELSGGVSNIVLYVRRAEGQSDFVIKQAREKLRVQADWRCGVERVLREVDVLRVCERLLPPQRSAGDVATVPRILQVDAENYLFAMTAAPPHTTWKQQLLEGRVDQQIGAACGDLLAQLHRATWQGAGLPESLHDRQFFEDLRVDPYYRQIARVHRDLEPVVRRLIDSVYANRLSLVHGDFSPKNLLVHETGLMLVDFEVGHFGDPAFDIGFFLTHLALKALHRAEQCEEYLKLIAAFVSTYFAQLADVAGAPPLRDLSGRARRNFAACLLARVDGKSPVEYLDESARRRARNLGRQFLWEDAWDWSEACNEIRQQAHAGEA